jgi:peptidoglycan/xylan/chitin deacetylase (PgdA/CDA1 family)
MPLFNGKRELLARALGHTAFGPISRAVGVPGLLGLTYHRVCDYDLLDDGVISASVDEFGWQLSFIKDRMRVLSGEEVVRLVRGELELREPALCITFDDGYADNLNAGRMLAEHGLPAIFFVTTGFIGTDNYTHWDRVAYAVKQTDERRLVIPAIGGHGPWTVSVTPRDSCTRNLRAIYLSIGAGDREALVEHVERAAGAAVKDSSREIPPFMSWDHVRELRKLGHTIGAHTHSHVILSGLSVADQARELRTSREIIERELGGAPDILAYPNGKPQDFTAETKAVAKEAGFAAAFSFYGGRNPCGNLDAFDLRRAWVSPSESRDLFRARISFPQILA